MNDYGARKRRARAFLLIVAGILGVAGFLRDSWGSPSLSAGDHAVAVIAAALLAGGIVTLLRAR